LSELGEFDGLTDEVMDFSSRGIRPGLTRVSRLLRVLGSPEEGIRAIHVLGTNGKGSTAATMEAILRASGMRTALYTSPHLVSLQERLRIDGGYLPIATWRNAWSRVRLAVESDAELSADRPSFFENFTALSLLMASESSMDAAVIEAGMGGRYDATSVCRPSATLINPIGMDHMEYLGPTIEAIAGEKFAAVKSGVDAFYSADDEPLARLFTSVCRECGAPCHLLDAMASPFDVRTSLDGTSFSYRSISAGEMTDLRTPLIGFHQAQNATRAITTLLELAGKNPAFSGVGEAAVRSGLAATDWPGRMEVVRRHSGSMLMLDGAHNEHGASALVSSLSELRDDTASERRIEVGGVIFAVMRDKDAEPILRRIAAIGCPVYCTSPPMERALPASELAGLARSIGIEVGGAFPDPSDALDSASHDAGSKLVVCCGSLFLVGHMRKVLMRSDFCAK
jgi:dihydrofolate synthase/folylpolyglutamate synthase